MLGRYTSEQQRARSGSNRISMRSSGDSEMRTTLKRSERKKKHLPRTKIKGAIHVNRGISEKWQFSASSQSVDGLKDAACALLEKGFTRLHSSEKSKKLKTLLATVRPAIYEFVSDVEEKYNKSAFHSFVHAVDVAQLMFTLLEDFFLLRIKKEEYFYLIVAALCHDICHPGAGAKTLVSHGLLEEGVSLETYHIQKTVEILEGGEYELFTNPNFLSVRQRRDLVRYCRVLIGATDIARHKQYVDEANNKALGKKSNLAIEHLAILMKVSDLANIARDFKDSASWSENFKIETEAEKQFLAEHPDLDFGQKGLSQDEQMKLLSSILCSKQATIRTNFIKQNTLRDGTSQTTLNFMQAFAFPLVDCLRRMNPIAAQVYGKRIRHNQECWNNLRL